MLLILAEKNSAARAMGKALGGMTGSFNNTKYKIVASRGHLLTFKEPHEMVESDYSDEYKSWQTGTMPWNTKRLNWKKKPIVAINPKTRKRESTAGLLSTIKSATSGVSAIVIATDVDPSGEGELLAWEIINSIGWTGNVKRMYFGDESVKSLQSAFKSMVDLPSQFKDGDYVKADVRSRFDFISMQVTRIATTVAKNAGYDFDGSIREGRLKSVIVKLVNDQLDAYNNYKRVPYYEVKYKDSNGNTYSRKFNDDSDFRFASKTDADNDMKRYGQSAVVQKGVAHKSSAPGQLLDLAKLAAILSTKGYDPGEVKETYQKMYDSQIVSYPRTEDKYISQEQFNDMLPIVDKIAGVVGVNTKLLTHRTPRKTHIKEGGAHGANRPGMTVPASLSGLSSFGKSGPIIYEILAKNFLAMFGEDYIYDRVTGYIKDYPEFVTTVSVPVKQGFKDIFDTDSQTKADKSDDGNGSALGQTATSFIHEGANKRPPYPSMTWLVDYLDKYNVGTGATRTETIAEISNAKGKRLPLLILTKGKFTMAPAGQISAHLITGTYISDIKITETLFNNMKLVGEFKLDPKKVIESATTLIAHDKPIIMANGKTLKQKVGDVKLPKSKRKGKNGNMAKEKITHTFGPTGQEITFSSEWSGHAFTEDEIASMMNGETIEIEAISSKSGKPYTVKGTMAEQTYDGRKFWGFKPQFEARKKAEDMTAQEAPFKAEWSGHKFTKDEEQRLRDGERVEIEAVSARTGNTFTTEVTFEITSYNGSKFWGIVPHFN